jgi:inosine-uridine nucleoside N-ribohydrolase
MRFLILIFFTLITNVTLANTPKNFIIDTDAAPDDVIAILYFLKQPDVHIEAITIESDGNAHCKPAFNNIKKVLQITHHEAIPVACGQPAPLKGSHRFPEDILKECDTLMGVMPENPQIQIPKQSAEALMSSTLDSAKKPVFILAIAPLTTIAQVLEKHPDLKNKISQIYIMGGAIKVAGNIKDIDPENINETAEWNIYIDPYAAERVFHSGVKITLVPLDVTNTIMIDNDFYQSIKNNHRSPEANFVFEILDHNKKMIFSNIWYFWDPMAAVLSLQPKLARFKTLLLSVKQSPEKLSGANVIDKTHGTKIRVAMKIQRQLFKNHMVSTLTALT